MERVCRYQQRLKASSITQIIGALKQLLSEDIRTDRLTDVAKLRCANLNLKIETALQVIAAAVNHLEVTKQYK